MEQLSRPQLGTCNSFRVQKYLLKNGEAKTLMFFDGCPPELGCTVTLRGGNGLVLAKVKKIVQFLTFVAHSQKLETSFLMDEFALPEDPSQYFDRLENSNTTADANVKETKAEENIGGFEQENFDTANVFQRTLDRTVLSCSPYVQYPLPYLLTQEGSKCAIRARLPKDIYWSERLRTKRRNAHLTEEELDEFEPPLSKRTANKSVEILPSHPLVWSNVVVDVHDQFLQGVVADFRSQGGRIRLKRAATSDGERRKSKWLLLDMENSEKITVTDSGGERKASGSIFADKTPRNRNQSQVLPASPVHFNKQTDCLDPVHHQRIAVLFSSYSSESNNSPRPCISPWAVFMEFYGRNDITLGGFLERYCFRPSYVCPNPNCDVPMVDHVRYFAHGNGSVYINMKNLESPIPGFHHTILTWSWCKECKQVTPIVPLSADAWALSFAKYIELRFYADKYSRRASIEPCGHSLHREHFQYFAFANMVASFKYRSIKLFETAIPPSSIHVNDEVREATYWVRDVEAIANRGDTVFASIFERLDALKFEKLDYHTPERETKIQQFQAQLEENSSHFTEQVQVVTKKANVLQSLQNPSVVSSYDHLDKQDQIALGYVIADSLNGLKRILCENVDNWNNRLQEFVQAEKKRSNKISVTTNQRDTKAGDKVDNIAQNLSAKSTEESTDDPGTKAQYVFVSPGLSPAYSPWSMGSSSPLVPNEESESMETSDAESHVSDVDSSNQKNAYFRPINPNEDTTDVDEARQEPLSYSEESTFDKSTSIAIRADSKPFARGHRRVFSSPPLITVAMYSTSCENNEAKSVLMRSHSDSDVTGMETLLAQKQENSPLLTSDRTSRLTSSTTQERIASSQASNRQYKRPLSYPDSSGSKSQQPENGEDATDGTPVIRKRDKMKNIISSFLPGSTYQPIASSFPSHEHHLLPAGEKVLVVVNEKEPSSIIAYALSTKEYHQKLHEIQVALGRLTNGTKQENNDIEQTKQEQELGDSYRSETSPYTEAASVITVDDTSEDFVNVEIRNAGNDEDDLDTNSAHVEIIEDVQQVTAGKKGKIIERVDKVKFSKTSQENCYDDGDGRKRECAEQQLNTENRCFSEFGFQPKDAGKDCNLEFHIQMQFSYNVCRFYCNAYYADQFKNLRKHIFEGSEERYIRSLAHCAVWRARGGKSGSTFSKTLDDRFVLKQMSRLELQSFVEFAPHYFQYMNKAITEKRSTLLAKIFGVYRIGFKNTQTNTTMRQDVLVMENLLYNRKIDKTFDLKGSMRSRYVQVSAGENDVLMDENLLEMIRENPIFIRPHSKAVLSKAIHNDTEFLAQHMVMDYSLLVGIDEMRSELVIGIIDFIRTFTWDKKLEMYVKSSGILGGQGKMPTVVSPELYRTRFTEAMHRYFLMVPDKWTGLGNDLD